MLTLRSRPPAEEAKKAQKLEVKAELKALSLSHVPPAFVTDTDCDAVLKSLKLPVSLPLLTVKYDTHRSINKAASFYSKTKAAHRCGSQLRVPTR